MLTHVSLLISEVGSRKGFVPSLHSAKPRRNLTEGPSKRIAGYYSMEDPLTGSRFQVCVSKEAAAFCRRVVSWKAAARRWGF